MAHSDTDAGEETALEAYHRKRKQGKKSQADVEVPVEHGDSVNVTAISGIPEAMLDSVDGYPVEGTVRCVEYRTEGCRNLMCEAVVHVHITEQECPAVYNGTTEIYPVGGTRKSWAEAPIAADDTGGVD